MELLSGHIAMRRFSNNGSFQAEDFGAGSKMQSWFIINNGTVDVKFFDGTYVLAAGKTSPPFTMQTGYCDTGTYFFNFVPGAKSDQSIVIIASMAQ